MGKWGWIFLSMFLLFVVVILSVLVGALSTGLLSSNNNNRTPSSPNLQLKDTWTPTSIDNNMDGIIAFNRFGSHIGWVSSSPEHVSIHVGGYTAKKFHRLSHEMPIFQTEQAPLDMAIDDTGYQLALLFLDHINIYIRQEQTISWGLVARLEVHGLSLVFDDKGYLLYTQQTPYGIRYAHHDSSWSPHANVLSDQQEGTSFFGFCLRSQSHFLICSDTGIHNNQGRVYVLKRSYGENDSLYTIHQTLSSSSDGISFGSQVCLDYDAKRLFVAYGPTDRSIAYYARDIAQVFVLVQHICIDPYIPASIHLPRAGFKMSCNESYLAFSSVPGDEDNQFGSILIYTFDKSNRATRPQHLIQTNSTFGTALHLYPLRKDRKLFDTLTLVTVDSTYEHFGQLLFYQ